MRKVKIFRQDQSKSTLDCHLEQEVNSWFEKNEKRIRNVELTFAVSNGYAEICIFYESF